jgi:hypothetical protein
MSLSDVLPAIADEKLEYDGVLKVEQLTKYFS